jgi:acetyltransferase-like isoleucine patch superfamily enzyme
MLREAITRVRGEQTIDDWLELGLNSSGNFVAARRVHIDTAFAWAITIGEGAILAHDVIVTAHDAAFKRLTGFTRVRPVSIGDRAYIGAGAILLPGAHVGDESIVGAGAVVTGNIPREKIVVGNPARIVADVADERAVHEAAMETLPVFDARPIDVSLEERLQMRDALEAAGTIYVR